MMSNTIKQCGKPRWMEVGCMALFPLLFITGCSSGVDSSAPVPASAATGQKTSGSGNVGTGNVGTGNVGTGNVGTGNVGTGNVGTSTPTISGVVTRSAAINASGTGTLCVAIANACLSMSTLSTYKGYLATNIANANFVASGTQVAFSIPVTQGVLTQGTTYSIIASLEDGGGNCRTYKQNDLVSWDQGGSSPCAIFTYDGNSKSGLSVDMNTDVPFLATPISF